MKKHFTIIVFYSFLFFLIPFVGRGQVSTWGGGTSGAWLTAGNWSPTGAPSGVSAEAYFNNNTQVANGINMNGISAGNSSIGAIHWGAGSTTARTITNSAGAVAGTLTLNGLTLNSVANTIIRNASTATHTITNGTPALNIGIGNTTDNVISIDGNGGINIISLISGANRNLTKAGSGSGVLTLSGANTYTGNTKITQGILRLGAAGVIANASKIELNGGTLSTGATTGFSETVSTLILSENSTIALGTGNHSLTFAASSAESWTSGKVLNITGWAGSIATGTTGTAGKIFFGASNSGLSSSQLAQIKFVLSGINYPAMILSTGEIVPTLNLVVTNPGNQTAGVGFDVTVTARDFDGIARNLTNATGITLSSATNTIGGTTTGSISAGGNNTTISGVTLTAGNNATITATRSSGDQPLAGTSGTFDVTSGSSPNLLISGTPTNHGSVCPNTSASSVQYTITNSGSVQADGITVLSNDGQFVVSGLSSTSIASSGGTATYNVTFTPTTTGIKSATITVASTTSGSNSPTSSLTGTGTTSVSQVVSSSAATSIDAKSATLNGNVTTLGVCPATTEKGFVYSLTSDNASPTVGGSGVTKTAVAGISTGAYSLALSNLPSSSAYSFRAYVYDGTTYTYGSVLTFTTSIALVITGTTSHGSVCPGIAATPITYTITNNGATSVSGIAVGSSDAQFATGTPSSTTIVASGTATYTVTFTPASSGAKSATITVSSSTPGIVSATSSPTGSGTIPAAQEVTSSAATSVSLSSATLNGNLTTLGICPATTEKGFVYSQTLSNSNPLVSGTGVTKTTVSGITTGAFTLNLNSLPNSTDYSFKAYVYDGTTYTYGSVQTFTTLTPVANDECNAAINLTVNGDELCTSSSNGTLINSSSSVGAITCASNTGTANDDVWYKFTATGTSHIVTVTPTNSWDVVVDVRSGSCNGINIGCADAYGTNTNPEVVTLTGLTPTAVYYVRIYSFSSTTPTTPTFSVCVTTPANICLNETFDDISFPPTGWTYTSVTHNTNNPRTGARSAIFNGDADEIISPLITNLNKVSFWYKRSGTAPGSPKFMVYTSSSASGPWTQLGADITSFTTTYQQFSQTIARADLYVRILHTRSSGVNEIYLDDFEAFCSACTPPSDPSGTVDVTENPACNSTTLSYSPVPPSGVTYYWQTSASGQLTTNLSTDDYTATVSGNYYIRARSNTGCWSNALSTSPAISITSSATSIAPTASQNILTTNDGTQLTVNESAGVLSRKWKYSSSSGSGYTDFSPGKTATTYTPNFTSAGTYYIVCESAYPAPCGSVISNEVIVVVSNPGPPIISHTALGNTTSTTARTATATITSGTALTCTPSLNYKVNEGTWASVNGTNTSGNNWSFTIPGQVANSLIEYFITACNSVNTVTSPSNVTQSSPYSSFNEYSINCPPASSGTQTVAFQGFEFPAGGYSFSINNTSSSPTGFQNYPAHANAVEWTYFNQNAASTRNSCMCVPQSLTMPFCSQLYGASPGTAPTSASICDYANGNRQRGVMTTNSASDYPASSRIRNGSYSYQHRQNGEVAKSIIFFDNIAIPDHTNASNIKVRVYAASISSTSGNGADNSSGSSDYVAAYVKTGSSAVADADMISDLSCALNWSSPNSDYSASNALSSSTSNRRWDFNGANGNQSNKNLIEIAVPDNTANVRLVVSMQNNALEEIWAVDDIQIIADYPTAVVSSGRYFRSRQNGKWESSSTWESATTLTGTYSPSCEIPNYQNSDSIIVRNGDTVRIISDVIADQLIVENGGSLILENNTLTINDQVNSVDLVVNGTFTDNALAGKGVVFNTGASWSLGSSAAIIKTGTSPLSVYKDYYQSGMSNIPSTAIWKFMYKGTNNLNVAASGYFYPNLYFENATSGNYSFPALVGTTGGYCTVKGSLFIGTTGIGTVTVYNNNTNTTPMTILGNTTIGTGSSLISDSYDGAVNTTRGNGTGFNLKGDLTVNGLFDANNGASGLVNFSGTGGTQTIGGNGNFSVFDFKISKDAGTFVDQQVDIEATNALIFSSGILKTNSNTFYLSNSVNTAISGGQTSGTDKYIQGKLKWKTDGASYYTFPIGHSTQDAQGFTIDVTGADGSDILGFLETNNTSPLQPFAYCDFEKHPGGGVPVDVGSGNIGYDGVIDQVALNLESPLQWNVTNPGGGISSYNITVHANGTQDINPVVSANGLPVRYLMKNGEPGNPGFNTGTGAQFTQTGFLACPNGYSLSGMTSFSDFTLNGGNAGGSQLPVKLLFFNANRIENKVKLNWATSLEINNEKFEIERSADAVYFTKIATVKGGGNTTNQQNYSAFDEQPISGWNYYRLKQIDFDQTFEYSNIASVYFEEGEFAIAVYPNPAQNSITIKTFGEAKIHNAAIIIPWGRKSEKLN